jgi:HAD superfamily hydrolase (TIGR01509 family)
MFKAVLFDCDGILVNSEPITLRVLMECLRRSGWPITLEQCIHHFLGRAVKDQAQLFFKMTGTELTENWLQAFRAKRDQALEDELTAVDGIHEAVAFVDKHFERQFACASGADRIKLELQLNKVNLMSLFEGRIFSGHEMPKTKPAPDVYLAAARHLDVPPQNCLVIEDTPTGVLAGASAGATVWAYLPKDNTQNVQEADLLRAGASRVFQHMSDLPELIRVCTSS